MTQPSPSQAAVAAVNAEIAATLVRSYVQATAQLRQQVRATALMWFGAHGFRGPGAAAFVKIMLPILLGAQRTMAQLTDGYLAQQIATLSGKSAPPLGISDDLIAGPQLRNGVPLERVLRRPHEQVWSALDRGKSFGEAVKIGRTRAESVVTTNLQLAKTKTSQRVMRDDSRVVGYRRVLTGVESCGLCVVASTLRYRKADLMPIHPGCDCGIAPIIGEEDPGTSINSATVSGDTESTGLNDKGAKIYDARDVMDLGDLLEPVHRAIEERFGERATGGRDIDYRKVLLTRQHGELGPVLTVRRHKFTKRQVKDIERRSHGQSQR